MQLDKTSLVDTLKRLNGNAGSLLHIPATSVNKRSHKTQIIPHSKEIVVGDVVRPRAIKVPYMAELTSALTRRRPDLNLDTSLLVRSIDMKHVQTRAPWKHYRQLFRVHGHIASVYCASFDRTSSRIITGSDDYLVKVWNAETGWLIHTLRGHQDVVVDVAVNEEGTLVASASQDNTVRVWDLKTGFPVAVLSSRVNARKGFTALQFSPAPLAAMRYLLVTGEDGNARLWKWDKESLNFEDATPLVLDCKSTQRDEARCCSFNNTGSRFVIGGTDGLLRLFAVKPTGEVALKDVLGTSGERHIGHVSVVHFSKDGKAIVSGGVDACINVWKLKNGRWRGKRVDLKPMMRSVYPNDAPHAPNQPDDGSPTSAPLRRSSSNLQLAEPSMETAAEPDAQQNGAMEMDDIIQPVDTKKMRISVLCWSTDSTHIVTSTSDRMIRVFSDDGDLIHSLAEHEDECFVLCPHPVDASLVLSAGHDGKLVLWDIVKGSIVWKTMLEYPILEAKFSDDAFRIVVSDSWGAATMFGIEDGKRYADLPLEQYFPTDYSPMTWDQHLYAADAESGQLPHLMPRVPVGNSAGGAYAQRHGKEREGLDLPVEPPHGVLAVLEEDRKAWLEMEPQEEQGVVDLEQVRSKKRRRVEYESDDEDLAAILNEVAELEATDNDEDYSGHDSVDEPEADFFDEDSEHYLGSSDDEQLGSSDDNRRRRTRKHPGPSSPSVHLRKRVRKTYVESDEESPNPDEFLDNVASTEQAEGKPKRKSHVIKAEFYQPTPWITETVQKSVPYRPQLMDRVVYLASGHEKWWNLAMEGAHENDEQTIPPVPNWLKNKLTPPREGDRVVFCRIVNLNYEMGPPAFCRAELQTCEPSMPGNAPSGLNPMWSQRILPEELQDTREIWECAWLDKPGAADFIVPLHRYLESMQMHYAVGDNVLIEFEEGNAEGVLTKQPDTREDPWASWTVKWDDAQEELFSPWEFVKEGEALHPSPGLTDEQKTNVLTMLDSVMTKREWGQFVAPVDKTVYPRYYRTTPFPVCLEQIRQRVESGWYRSAEHLVWELKQMQLNATDFNDAGTAIHSFAVGTLDAFIAKVNAVLNGRSIGAAHRPARKMVIKLTFGSKNAPTQSAPPPPRYTEPEPEEFEDDQAMSDDQDGRNDHEDDQDEFVADEDAEDEFDDDLGSDDFDLSDDEPRRRNRSTRRPPPRAQARPTRSSRSRGY